jgi:hypothetical protein
LHVNNKVIYAFGAIAISLMAVSGYLIADRSRLEQSVFFLSEKIGKIENNQRHSLRLHEESARESLLTLNLINHLVSTLVESGVLAKSGERLSPVVVWKRNPKYTGIGPVSKIKKGSRVGHRKGKKSR